MRKAVRLAILIGVLLIAAGLAFLVWKKIFPLGELPGDVTFGDENSRFYFPFTTSLVISATLSALVVAIFTLF